VERTPGSSTGGKTGRGSSGAPRRHLPHIPLHLPHIGGPRGQPPRKGTATSTPASRTRRHGSSRRRSPNSRAPRTPWPSPRDGAISAVLLGLLSRGDHLILQASVYGPTLSLASGPSGSSGSTSPSCRRPSSPTSSGTSAGDAAHLRRVTGDLHLRDDRPGPAGRRRPPAGCGDGDRQFLASPIFQRPARLGIDLVLHSGTKYIGGTRTSSSGWSPAAAGS